MTNTVLLREKIESMGIKLTFVAERLGLSKQALDRKLKDGSDFKAYQMIILKDMIPDHVLYPKEENPGHSVPA